MGCFIGKLQTCLLMIFVFLKRTDVPVWQEFLFPVSLTKFVCPWPVLSLSNLNGISDEYKIQIQVSQDKQYFDCILNKEDRDKLSHTKYKISQSKHRLIISRVFIKYQYVYCLYIMYVKEILI